MKKYLLYVAIVCGLTCYPINMLAQEERVTDSYGQNNFLYLEEKTILLDETGKGELRIWLNNETPDFNTFIVDLFLPDGFIIPKNSRGIYSVSANNGDSDNSKTYNHSISVGDNETFYRVLGTSMQNIPIFTSDDLLFTITIQAPDNFMQSRSNVDEGKITNIEIAAGTTGEKPHYFPDINFNILQNIQTTINEVEFENYIADDIFNLYGICIMHNATKEDIDSLTPGIYIIGGKKVIVR